MSKPLKYKIDGELVTRVELRKKAYEHARTFDADTRKAYLESINEVFAEEVMKSKLQTIYIPFAGVFLLLLVITIAFFTPFPSHFQSGVFWVVLSLAAAAGAALIPGFIEFTYQNHVRAGGALAVFCLMYLSKPAIMAGVDDKPLPRLWLYIVAVDTPAVQQMEVECCGRTDKVTTCAASKLGEYYGAGFTEQQYICYRRHDGKIYKNEKCNDIQDYEILMIPDSVAVRYADKRQAYLHFSKLLNK